MEGNYRSINNAMRNVKMQDVKSLKLKRNDYCHCGRVIKKKLTLLNKEILVRVKYKNCCMNKDKNL